MAQEGAFGTRLLESDITNRPLMFGKNGILDISKNLDFEEQGFQIKYNIKDKA